MGSAKTQFFLHTLSQTSISDYETKLKNQTKHDKSYAYISRPQILKSIVKIQPLYQIKLWFLKEEKIQTESQTL